MKRKIKSLHIDYGFGFPVKLRNVPMVYVRGVWTPSVNYNLLAESVLKQLSEKDSRLSGDQVRFIRQHFEMTLQEFSSRFSVTHPCVIKWEKAKNKPSGMNWATEKDIRLFILSKLSSKSKDIADLYQSLEHVANDRKSWNLEVDLKKIAA